MSTTQEKITQASVLICDGIPVGLPEEKVSRLTLFLKKMILPKAGALLSDEKENVKIVIDKETGKTSGIVFIDFKNDEAAITFKARYPTLKFDDAHTLKFYTKKDVDIFLKESDTYNPLPEKPLEFHDFKGWLRDEKYIKGDECFATFEYDKNVTVGWYDPRMPTEVTMEIPEEFDVKNINFSPAGTFMYKLYQGKLTI